MGYEECAHEIDTVIEKNEGRIVCHLCGKELDRKIRLTKKDMERITATPPCECWLCAYFSELVDEDENGYFLWNSDLKDDGMREHLRQLIGNFER